MHLSASASKKVWPGWWGLGMMGGATVLAVAAGLWKVLTIGAIAFGAMAGGGWLGSRRSGEEAESPRPQARRLAWAYGLTSGAMIASTGAFLVPGAVAHHAAVGGFGVAGGVLLGFSLHAAQHQLAHLSLPVDATTLELTVHALAAGLVIGAVYATMPSLGLSLGLAIVSHKAPAGFAAARRLRRAGRPASILLVPAAAVVTTAVPVGALHPPSSAVGHALVFGLATGVFLHVALDFLPRCEIGGEVAEAVGLTEKEAIDAFDAEHHLLDRLRLHAVASAWVGGLLVVGAWWSLPG